MERFKANRPSGVAEILTFIIQVSVPAVSIPMEAGGQFAQGGNGKREPVAHFQAMHP